MNIRASILSFVYLASLTSCGGPLSSPSSQDSTLKWAGQERVPATRILSRESPELQPRRHQHLYAGPTTDEEMEPFCPDKFGFDVNSRLCVSATQAVGPFPSAMIERCERFGGGPACREGFWSRNFAEKIRGTGLCPSGSVRRQGLCVEGSKAFGPFSRAHVANCKTAGAGDVCETMRWDKDLALKTRPVPSTGDLTGVAVAIDSGHGRFKRSSLRGFDVGAVSPFFSDVKEWQRNLDVATQLKSKFEARGAKVSLFAYLNESDVPYLELEDKGSRASGHDIFLSVHHNASEEARQGSEVYVLNGGSSPHRDLAAAVQRSFVENLWEGDEAFNNGVFSANFGVLRGATPQVEAAALLEGFYLDTRGITLEKAIEMDVRYAEAVAEGVAEYWSASH